MAWRFLDRLIVWLVMALVLLNVFHVGLDVALKYLFLKPVPGTTAYVAQYYMVALVYLPLASAEYHRMHIALDLIPYRSFGRWVEFAQSRFALAFCAAVTLLLAYGSWIDAVQKLEARQYILDQSSYIYIWPSYFFLPIGLGLLALLYVTRLFSPPASDPDADMPGAA